LGGFRLAAIEFYLFLMMKRVGPINPKHCGQMLHQQYICNHYNAIEQQRLYYHRMKDTDLTGEDFGMMLDAALPTDGQGLVEAIGRRIILSPSFYEGPRHMEVNHSEPQSLRRPTAYESLYLDVMAVVRRFAKPH
jgi:hypothetical protein